MKVAEGLWLLATMHVMVRSATNPSFPRIAMADVKMSLEVSVAQGH